MCVFVCKALIVGFILLLVPETKGKHSIITVKRSITVTTAPATTNTTHLDQLSLSLSLSCACMCVPRCVCVCGVLCVVYGVCCACV